MTWLSTLSSLATRRMRGTVGDPDVDEAARIIGACLRAHEVTRDLGVRDRERLAAAFEWRSYAVGERLIREGDVDDDRLFLLDAGRVRVERAAEPVGATAHHLADLEARCCVGEVSFLAGRPRMASVVATTPVRALVASRARLDQVLAREDRLRRELLDTLRLPAVDKLARANDHAVSEAELRGRFGHFIVLVMILLVIQNFLTGAFEQIVARVPIYVYSLGSLGFAAAMGVLLMPRIVGQPLTAFGLSGSRWRRGVVEGLVLGAAGWVVASWMFPHVSYGAFFVDYLRSPVALLYVVSVFLQELVFRGMFVTALQVFFRDARGLRSVALSSLVFSSMHVAIGWTLTGLTFVGGILFGLVYLRHRTLVGVCVVHFILGSLALGAQLMP